MSFTICIKKCKLELVNNENICSGCGRTSEEIKNWMNMSDNDKINIKEKSKKRLEYGTNKI